jgi:tRNA (guanine-N7-)-methyltransferase
MRLRNIPNANEIIEASPYIVLEPKNYKGKWHQLFSNGNPIYIEIGMGKGRFIKENAIKYPNINFIGIEKYTSVLARATKRIENNDLTNLKLICLDALEITEVFDKEIDLIFLNFSDPWPKDRHAKRRLTSYVFLNLYDSIFVDTKQIIQKTDNYNLFEYSCEQLTNHGYTIKTSEFNLTNMSGDNIMTEYEEKFLKNNNTIFKIEAVLKSKK